MGVVKSVNWVQCPISGELDELKEIVGRKIEFWLLGSTELAEHLIQCPECYRLDEAARFRSAPHTGCI